MHELGFHGGAEQNQFPDNCFEEVSARPLTIAVWASNRQAERIAIWHSALRNGGIDFSRLEPTGSLQTGHFRGAKPRNNSLNSEVPLDFHSIVEADVKLLLPCGTDVGDPQLVRKLEALTGLQHKISQEVRAQNRLIKFSMLYDYEDLGGGYCFEWELAVLTEPYFNHAVYYSLLTTPEELQWEGDVRHEARKLGLDFAAIVPLKSAQYERCMTRAVYSYALDRCQRGASELEIPREIVALEPPLRGNTPACLATLVDMLLAGKSGIEGLDHIGKELLMPGHIREKFVNSDLAHLCSVPPEPAWYPPFLKFIESRRCQQ